MACDIDQKKAKLDTTDVFIVDHDDVGWLSLPLLLLVENSAIPRSILRTEYVIIQYSVRTDTSFSKRTGARAGGWMGRFGK